VPLILSERDYKLVTIFTKLSGMVLFAASTIMLVDKGNVVAFLILFPLSILVALAPVPMTVLAPDTLEEDERLLLGE
jgi:hypothetical protein